MKPLRASSVSAPRRSSPAPSPPPPRRWRLLPGRGRHIVGAIVARSWPRSGPPSTRTRCSAHTPSCVSSAAAGDAAGLGSPHAVEGPGVRGVRRYRAEGGVLRTAGGGAAWPEVGRAAVGVVGAAALALGGITVAETFMGHPVSDASSSGTTIRHAFHGSPAPVPSSTSDQDSTSQVPTHQYGYVGAAPAASPTGSAISPAAPDATATGSTRRRWPPPPPRRIRHGGSRTFGHTRRPRDGRPLALASTRSSSAPPGAGRRGQVPGRAAVRRGGRELEQLQSLRNVLQRGHTPLLPVVPGVTQGPAGGPPCRQPRRGRPGRSPAADP